MQITPKQYAISLYESVDKKNNREAGDVIKKFVKVLINNNDISKFNKIIERFEEIWNKENGIVNAEVISARKLDNKTIKMLNNYIAELSCAKKVSAKQSIDKNILGGVVIRYEDKVLDGSLRTKLRELRVEMGK